MTRQLTDNQVRLLRLRAQRLYRPGENSTSRVAPVMKDIFCVQAQDPLSARLALWPRGRGLVVGDIERARVAERSIVRTWCMRGTLHLLPEEEVPWLLALHGPHFMARSKRRRAQLGLDDETLRKGSALLQEILSARGPLTRAEIVSHLAGRGITLEGQARPHFLGHAALQGLICFGPDRDGEPSYVLLGEWVEPRAILPREEALAELARRYLAAYGPATVEDLATWSGLPMGDIRAGWEQIAREVIPVEYADQQGAMIRSRIAWLEESPPAAPLVHLLPRFDTYLLGYRTRTLSVPPRYARRIHPGGGWLHPALMIDGLAAGRWGVQERGGICNVTVEPFEPLAPSLLPHLEQTVADLGRFLGAPVTLTVRP